MGLMSYTSIEDAMDDGDHTPAAALQGIYAVDEFMVNGNAEPPLITDSSRWRYFIIQSGYADVKTMTDKLTYYSFKTDTRNKTISLRDEDEDKMCTLQYSQPDSSHMVLTGTLFKDPVHITLKKKEIKDFMLVNRGFHWINEYPFNR